MRIVARTFPLAVVVVAAGFGSVGWPQPKGKDSEVRLTSVSGMFPCGARAGSSVTVTIGGERLGGARGFWCEHPGITGQIRPDGASDTQVQAVLTVKADVPPGLYQWRLLADRGASPPRFLAVSAGDEVVEKEPNDSIAQAQPIAIETAVNGNLDLFKDVDCYKLSGRAGQRVLVVVQSQVLGVPAELASAIVDASGKPLALGTLKLHGDPYLDFTCPYDGEFYVQVWNLTVGDQPGRVYRLTATRLPLLEFVFPAGGQRGQKVELQVGARDPAGTLGGAPDGDFQVLAVPLAVPADAGPELSFRVPGKNTFNSLPLVAGELPETLEREPNNEASSANAVPLPVVINGRLPERGDVDYFRFSAAKGMKLVLDAAAQQLGYRGDLLLTVFNAAGQQLAENNDRTPEQLDPRLEFSVPEDGQYLVRIQDVVPRRSHGPRFIYRLAIREPLADFRLTVKEPTPWMKPGDGVIVVDVEKLDGFDEEIELTVTGLPADVKTEPVRLGKGQNQAQLPISAPPARNDQHFPITIVGKATVGPRTLTRLATVRVLLASGGAVRSSFVTSRLFLSITDRDLGPPPPPVGAGIVAASSAGWKYIAAAAVKGNNWIDPSFDDGKWKPARTPVGYGEDVIAEKKGTPLELTGQNVYFRREFNLDAKVLKPGTSFKLLVAADDSAVVWINGKLVDNDNDDHEIAYWNREVNVPANVFVMGRNVIAVQLNNKTGSSDAAFDLQLDAQVPAGAAGKKP